MEAETSPNWLERRRKRAVDREATGSLRLQVAALTQEVEAYRQHLRESVERVEMQMEQYKLAYHALAERTMDFAEAIDLKRNRIESAERRGAEREKRAQLKKGEGSTPGPEGIVDPEPISGASITQMFESGALTREQAEALV